MKMRYCKKCRTYTFEEMCRKCGEATVRPHPPKFSPRDRYGEYRRKMKKEALSRGKEDGQL